MTFECIAGMLSKSFRLFCSSWFISTECLVMTKVVAKKWLLLASLLLIAVPATSYGVGPLQAWWENNLTDPVEDVDFADATTFRARLSDLKVVEGGAITIGQIVLVEGATTVTIDVNVPATLKTDPIGSSFKTAAAITIETEEGTSNVNGIVRGRITLRNGTYYLTGAVAASTSFALASNHLLIEVLSVPFYGTADLPVVPAP